MRPWRPPSKPRPPRPPRLPHPLCSVRFLTVLLFKAPALSPEEQTRRAGSLVEVVRCLMALAIMFFRDWGQPELDLAYNATHSDLLLR